MYVAKVPNRGSPPAVLLRESYREAGKVKNRTLANLSSWPEAKVDALARVLKGQPAPAAAAEGTFEIARSLPHGHVAAVLGTARPLGLEELIDPAPSRQRDLVTAMAVAQVIAPDSKLAIARGLRGETAASSLGEVLGVAGCDEDDLYAAMDWLAARQEKIEDTLAARHLAGGTLVLYDVSSAAFEGRTCPLGAIGHPKDGVRGRLQIVYGLLTSKEGVPVAIEVFEGNTGDPKTVASQVAKVKDRFGLSRVVLVGDRGMLTAARLREDVGPPGWTGSPRCAPRRSRPWSATARCSCPCSMRQTWPRSLTRTIPVSGWWPARTRSWKPSGPANANHCSPPPKLTWRKSPPRSRGTAGRCAARTRSRCARTGCCAAARSPSTSGPRSLTTSFSYARNQDSITAEAALDGIYVLRTTVTGGELGSGEVVSSYKALAQVERAFRAFNTDLDIRPIRHRTEQRVRAHVFLRMLSYYLTWHLHDRLAPLLFTDDDKPAAQAARTSPVAPAARSPRALAKAAAKHTSGGLPVHSFTSLLADLATICLNQIQPADPALPAFQLVTTPTPLQRQALDLLGVSHRLGVV